MNKLKKFVTFCLCIMFGLSLFNGKVTMAAVNEESPNVTVKVKGEVKAGEDIEISVKLNSMKRLTTASFKMVFDKEFIQPIEILPNEDLVGQEKFEFNQVNEGNAMYVFAYLGSDKEFSGSSKLLTLKCKVLKDGDFKVTEDNFKVELVGKTEDGGLDYINYVLNDVIYYNPNEKVEPAKVNVDVEGKLEEGNEINIKVSLEDLDRFFTGSVAMQFDPSQIEILDVIEDEALISKSKYSWYDFKDGKFKYIFTFLSPEEPINGASNFISIKCKVLKSGAFNLNDENFNVNLVKVIDEEDVVDMNSVMKINNLEYVEPIVPEEPTQPEVPSEENSKESSKEEAVKKTDKQSTNNMIKTGDSANLSLYKNILVCTAAFIIVLSIKEFEKRRKGQLR